MEYDRSLGLAEQPSVPELPPHQRASWMSSFLSGQPPAAEPEADVDYYELLRLDPTANAGIAAEAYLVMRNYYLRLIEQAGASRELVNRLAEGYEIISDTRRRREYDRARRSRRRSRSSARFTASAERAVGKETAGSGIGDGAGKRLPDAGTPAPADRRAVSRRFSTTNGHATGAARPGQPRDTATGEEPVSLKIARLLAANSSTILQRSVKFARKASQWLREALVEDGEEVLPSVMELTPEEEEALLERLSSFPDSAPSETQPAAGNSGVLAHLSIVEGPGFGREFDVAAVPFTLGDDGSCDVTLPGLARQQARLLHRNGQFVLFSLTDEPKTTIHGNSVAWGMLEDGDSFQIGPYVLKFETPSLAVAGR
jgi:hypothetical protein